ncbi:MAG: hypothetical protein NZ741_09490 [Armatimonadetes bacterium]|nr:hypothetical protein [Armatimonadota bacterium]
MRSATRATIILFLIVQGIYDLALGGWVGLLQTAPAKILDREQLHALYCRCTHCPDVAKCCCVPTQQVASQELVRQCDPADEGNLPNTWNCRVVGAAPPEISLLSGRAVALVSPLTLSLLPVRIEHPPRVPA